MLIGHRACYQPIIIIIIKISHKFDKYVIQNNLYATSGGIPVYRNKNRVQSKYVANTEKPHNAQPSTDTGPADARSSPKSTVIAISSMSVWSSPAARGPADGDTTSDTTAVGAGSPVDTTD